MALSVAYIGVLKKCAGKTIIVLIIPYDLVTSKLMVWGIVSDQRPCA